MRYRSGPISVTDVIVFLSFLSASGVRHAGSSHLRLSPLPPERGRRRGGESARPRNPPALLRLPPLPGLPPSLPARRERRRRALPAELRVAAGVRGRPPS